MNKPPSHESIPLSQLDFSWTGIGYSTSSKKKPESITRRNIVKWSALVATGAALGLLGCETPPKEKTKEPKTKEPKTKEQKPEPKTEPKTQSLEKKDLPTIRKNFLEFISNAGADNFMLIESPSSVESTFAKKGVLVIGYVHHGITGQSSVVSFPDKLQQQIQTIIAYLKKNNIDGVFVPEGVIYDGTKSTKQYNNTYIGAYPLIGVDTEVRVKVANSDYFVGKGSETVQRDSETIKGILAANVAITDEKMLDDLLFYDEGDLLNKGEGERTLHQLKQMIKQKMNEMDPKLYERYKKYLQKSTISYDERLTQLPALAKQQDASGDVYVTRAGGLHAINMLRKGYPIVRSGTPQELVNAKMLALEQKLFDL